ncbi:MAG: YitT family protein, partial [Turicibacter sp.]|nr:YitT family protein [Turicibacter sp.]
MSMMTSEYLKKEFRSLGMISIGMVLYAIGINWFINPSGLYVGGVTGISQLISRSLYSAWGIKINLGMLIWSINIPLLLISYKFIGKRF